MTLLDVFALGVLATLALAAVAAWVMLARAPGQIARQRNHPQADAIAACGWWGAITLDLLLPVAFIWAYTDPRWRERASSSGEDESRGEPS